MRAQGGVEAMLVTTALILILLTVATYSYFVSQSINAYNKQVEFFQSCSQLQVDTLTASFIDQQKTTYYLTNFSVNGTFRAAYPIDGSPYFCPLIIPVNGTISVPESWTSPFLATQFVSANNNVNITEGWMV